MVSFNLDNILPTKLISAIPAGLRLGKRVECFALDNLSQQPQIQVIANNVQILREKVTLGEIDAILLVDKTPIHLEIVYKFYLLDTNIGDGLQAWIGPNRKDSLVEKLNRLQSHQLPLLYQPESVDFLKVHQINVEADIQRVLFKAQMFLPEDFELKRFNGLNEACIAGRYFHHSVLPKFKNCKIYIPSKYDWLVVPHTDVDWMTFKTAFEKIETIINTQYAPMVWIKNPNGLISKYFITWWQ